jgi:polyisoprenoid-binding protein YceI
MTEQSTLVRYAIDTRASRFTVQAFVSGFLSAMGHNPTIEIRSYSGDVNFDPETLESGPFHMSIQLNSLNVQDDVSEKDRREIERLMNEQVIETSKYSQAGYEAAHPAIARLGDSLYTAFLDGQLSFHGVRRSLPITARIAAFGEMLRVSGDFTFKQSDYQIKPVSVAGGALKVKDDLKFSFEMVVRRQG